MNTEIMCSGVLLRLVLCFNDVDCSNQTFISSMYMGFLL